MIVDEDCSVEFPVVAAVDPNCETSQVDPLFVFTAFARLAVIISHVQTELYSSRTRSLSENELLERIGDLDGELLVWRESLPPGLRPEMPIKPSDHRIHGVRNIV